MSFLSGFRRYLRVLGALLRREEENRRQAPMESIINLLEPVCLIALMGFIFYFMNRRQVAPLGGAPILFYATGFFPLYFFIYVSRRMRGSIDAPQRRFPIEQRLDHVIVHILLRIIDYAILGIVLFGGIYVLFTWEAMPERLDRSVLACLAISGLGFGWGVLTMVMSRRHRLWGFAFPMVSRVLMLFSGIFFVPDFLNPDARYVLSFNPLMHAVQLFRLGFYPSYPAILLDTQYLTYSAIAAVLVGLVVERATRRSEGL